MTTPVEVCTLGLHLECDSDNIEYYLNKHQDVRFTTYQILHWFDKNYPDEVEKWHILIKALKVMDKIKTIADLGLEDLLENARKNQQS